MILGHIGTLAVNPYMYDRLPYDANKDFRPVSLLAKVPSLYVVNPNVPAKDLREFVALLKARPGQMNYIKAGKVRCISTGSTRRLPQLPDVPTVAEQGFPGFEMTQWYGMLAPATMAQANVDRLTAETMKAMKASAALERLAQAAAEPVGGTPAQFAQFTGQEQKRWKTVVERARIKPD